MCAACSSSGISVAVPNGQVMYGPGEFPQTIAEHLGMLPARASKEDFPERADLTQEATYTQIQTVVEPILKTLIEYAGRYEGAVKYSRRRFLDLGCSITVLSDGRVFIHTKKLVGKGVAKKVRGLIELKSRDLFTLASSLDASPKGISLFEYELQKEKAVYEKLKNVEGFPSCLAYTVLNAGGTGNSRGLLMKLYEGDLLNFCRIHQHTDFHKLSLIITRLMQHLIDQIAALHSKRTAHLDLKDNNILANPVDGEGAVIDYSLSVDFIQSIPHPITAGCYLYRPPEIPKGDEGFSLFVEERVEEHFRNITHSGKSSWFGRTLTNRDLGRGGLPFLQQRALRRVITEDLAYAYDVWGLGVLLGNIYFSSLKTRSLYPNAYQVLRDLVSGYIPIRDRSFERNPMINLILGMLEMDYEKRLTMVKVKEQFSIIREHFEKTGEL